MTWKLQKEAFMKKVFIIALVILLLFFAAGNRVMQTEEKQAGPAADWTDAYGAGQEAELVQDADLICVGKVVDAYTELRYDMVFTHQVIEIQRIDKGSAPERIEVLQTGGNYGTTETLPFREAPLLEKEEVYYLLLQTTNSGYYLPMGGFQGVGQVQKDKTVEFQHSADVFTSLDGESLQTIHNNVASLKEVS